MNKLPDDEFLERLQRLLNYLKRNNKPDLAWVVKKLLSDNILMSKQIDNYKKERGNEERVTGERTEEGISSSQQP